MSSKKKSCEKHKNFNYYCKDCQEANIKYEQELIDKKVLGNNYQGGNETPPTERRYRYTPHRRRPKILKTILYTLPIIVIITLLSIFWFFPAWHAGVNLNTQLYNNKATTGFLDIYFLNLWSSNFFWNKTALVVAFIGCIIMSVPPERNFMALLGTLLRFGKPSRVKALLFWWTGGFGIFFIIGQIIASDGQFSWAMYLIENGVFGISANQIGDAFNVMVTTNSTNFMAIFIYSSLYLPIINLIFGTFVFRVILLVFNNMYLRKNDYYLIASILTLIGLFFGMGFFSLPTFAFDGVQLIQIWAIPFGFFGFFGLGIFVYILGKIKLSSDPKNYLMLSPQRKKMGVMGLAVLILILIPFFISAGTWFNLNNTAVWTEQQWNKRYKREIMWTRACAGLDMFEELPIDKFSAASKSSDLETVSQIRQYDQDFALQYMAAKIGSTYEGLADSDIVYLDGKEYWVAPKTIRFLEISGDSVQTNTELYDHVEGFLAMDTYSGTLVNIESTFNIDANYPIFFGEHESEKFLMQQYGTTEVYGEGVTGAYDSNVLLGTEWSKGIENNLYKYDGDPDGKLTDLEAFWYTAGLGLWSYAFQEGEIPYLINRNIKTRVEQILLPNLKIDSDPYLVFDLEGGKMYYAVSIYTSIYVGSYSRSPILRFLGVCLIDVKNGEMSFYKNPTLSSTNDPTYPLWQIYWSKDKYPWHTAPDWLKMQLRYPEDLFEQQMEANYVYHVQDSTTWKREDDFQKRPEDGDVFYIETDLGAGFEYVGVNLVEYIGQEAKTLAGMYIIRHGSHFGEAIFYHTRNSVENLIGPNTARDTYESEATKVISLIADHRDGNVLLYSLGNSIYYYIPTYSTSGSLQQLKLAGFVEAFTREVGYGDNALEAYNTLGLTTPPTPEEFNLTSDAEIPADSDGAFTLNWTVSENAGNYSLFVYNRTITEVNNTLTLLVKDLTTFEYSISGLQNGTYYYIVEASNDYGSIISNCIRINVTLSPIFYNFEMDDSMIWPNDLASFRIELRNPSINIALGYNVTVNLSLYVVKPTLGQTNISIKLPPGMSVANSTFNFSKGTVKYNGVNYTLINQKFYGGQGIMLSGLVNCTIGGILIYYRWIFIIDEKEEYISNERVIYVYT